MISFSGRRSAESEQYMKEIKSRDWGLLLLDEVHVCPAKIFRKTLEVVRAHTTLGLTATLVREDDLIADLSFLLGPKLYEANWMDLTARGYLAKVMCCEVWCPMTTEFYREYLDPRLRGVNQIFRAQQRIFVLNPNKVAACRHLVKVHTDRGDKILVFSDDIFALRHYALLLKVPMLYGDTPAHERLNIIAQFKTSPTVNVICISSVGDTSIDLPECAVIIQVASHFGARRQEAQRLGRVLRPKSGPQIYDGYNAYFYSLVSTETREMYFAHRRQRYLADQGYTYKILSKLLRWDKPDEENRERVERGEGPVFMSLESQMTLLEEVINTAAGRDDVNFYAGSRYDDAVEHDGDMSFIDGFQEDSGYNFDDFEGGSRGEGYTAGGSGGGATVRRTTGTSLIDLSGAGGLAYAEVDN